MTISDYIQLQKQQLNLSVLKIKAIVKRLATRDRTLRQ